VRGSLRGERHGAEQGQEETLALVRSSEKGMNVGFECEMRLEKVEERGDGAQKAFFRHAHDLPDPADSALPTIGAAEVVIDDPKDTVKLIVGERYRVDFHHIPPQ